MLAVALACAAAACEPTLAPAPTLPASGTCTSNRTTPCCPTTATGVDFYGNLKYGHDNDFNLDLLGDAYLPSARSAPVSAVVLVHGGGHVGGDKCQFQKQAVRLAQQGLGAFSINYPLATSSHPASFEQPRDTRLAVQWVRANAAVLGFNPNHIGLWGASAGADLVFVAALTAQRIDPPARVQAVVGWSGAYDFLSTYFINSSSQQVANGSVYVGCSNVTETQCFNTVINASPLSSVAHDAPPSLISTSTNVGTSSNPCEIVPPQNTVEMLQAFRSHGAPIQVVTTSACGHALGYTNAQADAPNTGTMFDNTVSFLVQQLTGTPSAPTTPSPLPPPIRGPSVVTASSTCAPAAGSNVTITNNVVYGTDFNNPVYLDAYEPSAGIGSRPAIVLVHGGGHVSGDKCETVMVKAATQAAQHGYAVFSVNYPLATATQATFANPVYDIMNAVGYVRAHASTFGVDSSRIGLWGGSAGGNLALSAAFAAPFVQPSAAVKAVASWSGTADVFELGGEYGVTPTSGGGGATSSWAEYVGCATLFESGWDPSANACITRFAQASPAIMTDPFGSTRPPAVLVATSTDFKGDGTCEIVPPRQAYEVQRRAEIAQLTAELHINDLCAHAFGYLSTELPDTLAFFDAHM